MFAVSAFSGFHSPAFPLLTCSGHCLHRDPLLLPLQVLPRVVLAEVEPCLRASVRSRAHVVRRFEIFAVSAVYGLHSPAFPLPTCSGHCLHRDPLFLPLQVLPRVVACRTLSLAFAILFVLALMLFVASRFSLFLLCIWLVHANVILLQILVLLEQLCSSFLFVPFLLSLGIYSLAFPPLTASFEFVSPLVAGPFSSLDSQAP